MEAEIIWEDAIVRGHVQVWAGSGGAGKTTIALLAAKDLAAKGFDVLFLQEDAGAGDMPALQNHAENHNYSILNSAINGKSTDDLLRVFHDLIEKKENLSNRVFFLDTLKKFCDLMTKGGTREFFRLMRSLSTLGATIVLLGHTNKSLDHTGKPVFEGVGDVRNDVDELFYLNRTVPDSQGNVLVSVEPDKQRAMVRTRTFKINTLTREAEPVSAERSVAEINKIQQSKKDNELVISFISSYLERHSPVNLTTLTNIANKNCDVGVNSARSLILLHSSEDIDEMKLWKRTRLAKNNTILISKKSDLTTSGGA